MCAKTISSRLKGISGDRKMIMITIAITINNIVRCFKIKFLKPFNIAKMYAVVYFEEIFNTKHYRNSDTVDT